MVAFICLFFPAVLAVGIFEHLRKGPLSRRKWLYRYCTDVALINGICFAVKRYLLDTAADPFASAVADLTPSAALNYLIMAIPTAIILAVMQALAAKHVTVTVEEEKNA